MIENISVHIYTTLKPFLSVKYVIHVQTLEFNSLAKSQLNFCFQFLFFQALISDRHDCISKF